VNIAAAAPLVSGLVGTIIGALFNAYLRERSDRRSSRENLVAEVATFARDALAGLLELYRAVQVPEASLERWSKLAALERLLGKGVALEIRIFREFRKRRVRVAYRRLLDRTEALKDEIVGEIALSESTFKLGCDWIEQQISAAVEIASVAAGIDLVDRARILFVGFRKVSLEDRLALSFDPEPVPWRYSLAIQFTDEIRQEDLETITRRSRERVGNMLCPTHGHAPHIVLTGRSSNFEVEIAACCSDFTNHVNRRFMGLEDAPKPRKI
jgi:hypothetical protein